MDTLPFLLQIDSLTYTYGRTKPAQISGDVYLEVLDHLIDKQICAFYEGELGKPVLYVHSSGYLGITMNRSNASDVLGIRQGEKVSILVRGS